MKIVLGLAVAAALVCASVSAAGAVIGYTIVVTNTGNTDLTNVVVSDPFAGTATYVSGDTNSNGILDLGEAWTYSASYTVSQADMDAGTPLVNSSHTASGQIGVSFNYQIGASLAPTSYLASGLPAGLSLNSATGAITGFPTASGVYPVSVAAVNSTGQGAAVTVTVTIQPSLLLSF